MNQEVLLELFKYFAKFVPKEVLKNMFVKSKNNEPGYDELLAEVMALPDDHVIADIDCYIFSSNEEFLSQKIKNSKSNVLYVEYGAVSYAPNELHGTKTKLGLHVACPYNASNNDNPNELFKMSRQQIILMSILNQMEVDQKSYEFCGDTQLINFPAEIVAIDRRMFYDRTGWMGIFDYSSTNIL